MKAKFYFSFLFLLIVSDGCRCPKESGSGLNLGFEEVENGMPKGWIKWGNPTYDFVIDVQIKHSGKYSLRIESKDETTLQDFGCPALPIPAVYDGENITLKAFIRTEGVEQPIGLLLRIDGMSGTLQFDNMTQKGIMGSEKWEEYSVTLPMPEEAKTIYIGAILFGTGKMWIDDLQVTIDGVDIKDAKIYAQKPFPAEMDRAFTYSSNITIPLSNNLTSNEDKILITNLELMGKIWGFLKYHHPEVGRGNYNWDNELFRILPAYLKANGVVQRDEMLLKWIEKYGEIPVCERCKETSVDAFLKPDLSWIEQYGMSTVLKEKIKEIYKNRHQGDHYYVQNKYTFVPFFIHENAYSYLPFPDAGYRLLALYRYWNIIQYFYPYKYLTDKNWGQILTEYIPKFLLVQTELEYQLAVLQLIGEINDTHAYFLGAHKIDSLRGYWQAPFEVRFIENKLVVTRFYKPEVKESMGLNIGDIITRINGKEIEYIVDSLKVYYPASNEAVRKFIMANDLLRSTKDNLVIDHIPADGIKHTTELTLFEKKRLDTRKNNNEPAYQFMYGDNMLLKSDLIGYVTLKKINQKVVADIKKEFKNAKGIIIDIRNYPAAFVVHTLGSFFVADDTPFAKATHNNLNNPGEFTLQPPLVIPKSEEPYQG
ncbi:MAG: peptidase S41, partial [Bacteroidetes bacterium]|nr:peptidase S41 [Bacteroidota bacterium]